MSAKAHRPQRGIDLMKAISNKQARDLQQLINDNDKRIKKNHKRPVL
jgi:hypothetical protein